MCDLAGEKHTIWGLTWHQIPLGVYLFCLQDLETINPGDVCEPRLEPFSQANCIPQEPGPALLQAELTASRYSKITQHIHLPFYHHY